MNRSSFDDYVPTPEGSPRASPNSMCRLPDRSTKIQTSVDSVVHTRTTARCSFSKKRLLSAIIPFAIFIVVLDIAVLTPNFGYFNGDCMLTPQQLADLRKAVFAVVEIYEKYNQTYWLDYGTLLGVYRMGDIIPHDGDADISRLIPPDFSQEQEEAFLDHFASELNDKIGATTAFHNIVHFNGVSVDLARWIIDEDKTVYRYLRGHPVYTQFRRNFPGDPLPSAWFIPTQTVMFSGKMIAGPHDMDAVLNYHYGSTINVTLPYKWKCWFYNIFRR